MKLHENNVKYSEQGREAAQSVHISTYDVWKMCKESDFILQALIKILDKAKKIVKHGSEKMQCVKSSGWGEGKANNMLRTHSTAWVKRGGILRVFGFY